MSNTPTPSESSPNSNQTEIAAGSSAGTVTANSTSASASASAAMVCPFARSGSALPSDHPPVPMSSLPTLTLIELATYDGKKQDKIYICIKDQIFDVSSAPTLYGPGGPLSILAGHDITRTVALSTHTPITSVSELRAVRSNVYDGLTFDQLQWLETVTRDYQKRFPLVALLADTDATGSPGAPSAATSPSSLHDALDADDMEIVTRILQQGNVDVNVICTRTTMTPLHKAIEKGCLPVVSLLLSHGTSLSATCSLYDDATPLQLAAQFHFIEAVQLIATYTTCMQCEKGRGQYDSSGGVVSCDGCGHVMLHISPAST